MGEQSGDRVSERSERTGWHGFNAGDERSEEHVRERSERTHGLGPAGDERSEEHA